eukprot:Hpha_TRINITY_DN16333_c0_g2::TRINITY_DN16333_c0_g2_i3::g.62009::m.62009
MGQGDAGDGGLLSRNFCSFVFVLCSLLFSSEEGGGGMEGGWCNRFFFLFFLCVSVERGNVDTWANQYTLTPPSSPLLFPNGQQGLRVDTIPRRQGARRGGVR